MTIDYDPIAPPDQFDALRELQLPADILRWAPAWMTPRSRRAQHPEKVRKVITFGTPVIGGPRYNSTAARYRAQGHDLEEVERVVKDRYRVPLRVPVVAIYSKRDSIVAWQACIDKWSPDVRHVEVRATHIGMPFAPRVLGTVAQEVERA